MLLTDQRLGEAETKLTASKAGANSIEALRGFLSVQQQREIGYDEAKEVGASLVEFYEVLAEEVEDDLAN